MNTSFVEKRSEPESQVIGRDTESTLLGQLRQIYGHRKVRCKNATLAETQSNRHRDRRVARQSFNQDLFVCCFFEHDLIARTLRIAKKKIKLMSSRCANRLGDSSSPTTHDYEASHG
jgi:hypothetical protein